jgi:hypothetical protein
VAAGGSAARASERAAETAATLADLPAEPQAVEAIRELVRR